MEQQTRWSDFRASVLFFRSVMEKIFVSENERLNGIVIIIGEIAPAHREIFSKSY